MFGCCRLAAAADFGAEALDEILGRERPGQKHLHRDDPVQAHLPRSIDDAHPAPRDLLQQFVITKATECFCIGWSGWSQLSKRGNCVSSVGSSRVSGIGSRPGLSRQLPHTPSKA